MQNVVSTVTRGTRGSLWISSFQSVTVYRIVEGCLLARVARAAVDGLHLSRVGERPTLVAHGTRKTHCAVYRIGVFVLRNHQPKWIFGTGEQ